MITVIEQSAVTAHRDGSKWQIDTHLKPGDRPRAGKARRLDRPQGTAGLPSRAMVFSRYTHYDPLQVAVEDGLDAWVRHAAASNGFGDLL